MSVLIDDVNVSILIEIKIQCKTNDPVDTIVNEPTCSSGILYYY